MSRFLVALAGSALPDRDATLRGLGVQESMIQASGSAALRADFWTASAGIIGAGLTSKTAACVVDRDGAGFGKARCRASLVR